jgi:hypothetical protein
LTLSPPRQISRTAVNQLALLYTSDIVCAKNLRKWAEKAFAASTMPYGVVCRTLKWQSKTDRPKQTSTFLRLFLGLCECVLLNNNVIILASRGRRRRELSPGQHEPGEKLVCGRKIGEPVCGGGRGAIDNVQLGDDGNDAVVNGQHVRRYLLHVNGQVAASTLIVTRYSVARLANVKVYFYGHNSGCL